MNISGRFHLVEKNEHHAVVGLLGSARAERLTSANIKHIKEFYDATHLEKHRILDDFPVSTNHFFPASASHFMFNNFIEFYNEATHD